MDFGKRGHKHKTDYFGGGGEAYTASLFGMIRVDSGSYRPDLITPERGYRYPFALEVKSGKGNKRDMPLGSLIYCVLPLKEGGDTHYLNLDHARALVEDYCTPHMKRREGMPVYFDALQRVDGLRAEDLKSGFHSVKFKWGDQYLVPAQYVYASFVANLHSVESQRNRHLTLQDSVRRVKGKLNHILEGEWEESRQSGDWQNMSINDINYFLSKDSAFLKTEQGERRVSTIREIFPEVEGLIPVTIPGPNGTKIYVLRRQSDEEIFQDLERRVLRRSPTMERITAARRNAEKILEKVHDRWKWGYENFADGHDHTRNFFGEPLTDTGYTPDELKRLNRLQNWLAHGEEMRKIRMPKSTKVLREDFYDLPLFENLKPNEEENVTEQPSNQEELPF